MQETNSSGTYTYYDLTVGASTDTFFLTLPEGPEAFVRLQVNSNGDVKFISAFDKGTSESFRITEVGDVAEAVNVVHITKRNATDFAINGGRGAENGQSIYLYDGNEGNVNQKWIEIDRDGGYFSYQKLDTNHCMDGGRGGANAQDVYLWKCNDTNHNQHWQR